MMLPKNWNTMSLDALATVLNDPKRHPTPQSTIDAVLHCVRTRGVEALKEPANIERMMRCDEAAKTQINTRLAKLGARHD
jgi:hypothetical protein